MNFSQKSIWLQADEICIVQGYAAAQNLMFETKKDHELFLKLWDKYLGKMTKVINYHLSPTGWIILLKTNSKEEITSAYLEQRNQSRKAKKDKTLQEPERMLSEHIRIFLSQYVRKRNHYHGRRGVQVLRKFEKYIINKWIDYQKIFDRIVNKLSSNPQVLKKYQADESRYDKKQEMGGDSIWITGTRMYRDIEIGETGLRNVIKLEPGCSILRKYFNSTKYISPNTFFS